MKKQREGLQQQLDMLTASGQMDQSPAVKQKRIELSVLDHEIETYVESFNQGQYRFNALGDGKAGLMPLKSEVAALKLRIQELQEHYDKQKDICTRLRPIRRK